jgi:MFS family permease
MDNTPADHPPSRGETVPSAAKPRRFAALRTRNFRLLWIGQFISFSGSLMQSAAILWQVYALTHDPLALGVVGLVRLVPIFIFGILSGVVADSTDRRKLMIFTQAGMAALALAFAAFSFAGTMTVGLLYLLTMASAVFGAFDSPARQSLIPALVPREDLANAFSLNSTMLQAASALGPALAGLMIGRSEVGWVYVINAVSFLAVIFSLLAMQGVGGRIEDRGRISLGAAWEGMRFVFSHPIIRSTMLLDFIATFLGALSAGVVLSLLHRIPRQGPVLLAAVGLFSLGTVLFGVSRLFGITFLALALSGAADMVSMVIRNTSRQLLTPDSLRGRMVSLNMIFFMGGPQLGEFEAGAVADWLGAPVSVVIGGLGSLAATVWITVTTPELRKYRG